MRLEDFTVPLSGTLLDAVETIDHNHCRCALVVEGDKVVGVVSEGDVLRALLKGTAIHAPLASFANPGFKFLAERDLERALALFREHGITLVPVLDPDSRLVDVVTWKAVLDSVGVVR